MMQDPALFWDRVAEKYARRKIGDMSSYTYTLDRTRSYLSPQDRVLELGCGTGSTALLLAEGVAEVTASDLSAEMIRIGKAKALDQKVANVRFVTADLFDDALDQGPYDAVLTLNLLHLLEDPAAAARRIYDRLKSGGVFISKTVCAPTEGWGVKLRLIKLILPVMQWLGKAPHVNIMPVAELERVMTDAGFEIVESANYPDTSLSRYIVARKVA
jgi:2-polyprenyl-3-methyl-5-hydroxy-6-metoxy-1,4-benzoquinol methylase